MKMLVWHWGRRGAGPVFAARLATALRELEHGPVQLSLAAGAEILAGPDAPECGWREATYESPLGFILQRLASPLVAGRTLARLEQDRPDFAICAMPALLDGRMETALSKAGTDYGVIVHDAEAHPGENLNFRVLDQRRLLRGARCLFVLTGHVEAELLRQGYGKNGQAVVKLWHPAISFGAAPVPRVVSERPHILHFGRLLPYKGLDLLAGALENIGPKRDFDLRICGDGPNSRSLERLKAQPGIVLEQRWFADSELPGLLDWADALVLPYREASQSGVASLAIAAGKQVLATNVGGLPEQLGHLPQAILCEPTAEAIALGLGQLIARLGQAERVVAPVDAAADWRAMAAAMCEALTDMTREPKPVGQRAHTKSPKAAAEKLRA
jgi:glycosyltransferase involved in cell wall biosynthesis